MARILVIEDDSNLAEGLEYNLTKAGHDVDVRADGEEGLAAALRLRPDLVVLDLMLPGLSGFDILGRLREAGMKFPVVILSAKDAELDKIRGFDLGAVDYVTKPFGVGELLARIRTRLEQAGGSGATIVLEAGTIHLDRLLFIRGEKEIALTPTEAEILRRLHSGGDRPVEREELTRSIWGLGPRASRTLDTHVARLRKKIERDPARPRHLLTVHSVGFRLAL